MPKVASPKPTYLPFPAMLALQTMGWITENRATSDQRFSEVIASLPLGMMWLAVGCFTAGLLIQDLYNPESWIRQNFREARRLFKVGSFVNIVHHHGYALRLELVALRTLSSSVVSVTFTAVGKNSNLPRAKRKIPWDSVGTGEPMPIPIVSISAPMPEHSPAEMVWWGYDQETEWGKGDRHATNQPNAITRIDIEMRSSWRRQSETIFAICKNYNSPHASFLFWSGEDEVIYATE